MRAPAPVFSYETLFLSDLHLGSGKTASSYLYEFLTHLNLNTLKEIYLVGDIVGGWEQATQQQRAVPEMERRIIDVLNYIAAQGIKIHYVPGNHDERLRGVFNSKGSPVNLIGRLNASAQRPARANRTKVFSENVEFKLDDTRKFGGKKYRITHSDLHDPNWPKMLEHVVSEAYDYLIAFDSRLRKITQKMGFDLALAKNLKRWFKGTIEGVVARDKLLHELERDNCDGAFIGHTHMSGKHHIYRQGRNYSIVNDGDWQEGGSAAFIAPGQSEPDVIEYRLERNNYFVTPLPDENTPHPAHYAAHREQTDRQIRLMHRLWPVRRKSYLKQIEKYRHAGKKLREHTRDIEVLETALDYLHTRTHERIDLIRTAITDTAAKKNRFTQRMGTIRTIFARAGKDGSINEWDRRTLIGMATELRDRAEYKLSKHFNARLKAARNLDYVGRPLHPRQQDKTNRNIALAA